MYAVTSQPHCCKVYGIYLIAAFTVHTPEGNESRFLNHKIRWYVILYFNGSDAQTDSQQNNQADQ